MKKINIEDNEFEVVNNNQISGYDKKYKMKINVFFKDKPNYELDNNITETLKQDYLSRVNYS